jgi:iron(II)-dependent oxidoreductase
MLATQPLSSVANESVEINNLLERMEQARKASDELFRIVRPDSLYERPIAERHRIVFYIGHLEAFDSNLLRSALGNLPVFHPEFDRLFAFGIDPVGGGLPTDQPSDWPAMGDVREYVKRTRATLDDGLSRADLETHVSRDGSPSSGFSLATLLHVAIEHRLMHIETLAYMLHQLPLDRKIRNPSAPRDGSAREAPLVANEPMEIPPGEITLGLARGSGEFGWDNEFEAHRVQVPGFRIQRYKVTNAQCLEFVEAGGYDTREFWTDADWKWKNERQISHPAFWKRNGEGWFQRGMFEEIPLPANWPAHVSHAEASAYASWAGKRLPTEGQWQRAAYGTPDGSESRYPWGKEAPAARFGNFDLRRWDPQPVDDSRDGASAFGVHDLLGNGWEWTSTEFAPFAGFQAFPFYRGYSADFFDGRHFVLKGGSMRTAACMLRPSFRNWFQTHYQYVYAGFRCVD